MSLKNEIILIDFSLFYFSLYLENFDAKYTNNLSSICIVKLLFDDNLKLV